MELGLKILNTEIERLQKHQEEGKLDYVDIKRLEILLKTRQLLLNRPTEIVKTTDDYSDIKDKEVLNYLKEVKSAKKTKPKTKRKSSD